MAKALALFSGGLDSILAIRMVQEQGVEVGAIHFAHVFHGSAWEDGGGARRAAAELSVPLRVEQIQDELIEIVKSPKYGYGSNMNPCIDCRILIMKRAAELMRETGADFLVTGEVLGERPMSQRRDAMRQIEKAAGVSGLVLRPLCARLLDASIAEQKGWVNRERLLSISGRSRKPQLELAALFGIRDFPTPAGGCLLTDPGFAARMRDLLEHAPEFNCNDVELLKYGRHFRLGPEAKTAVGRNERENGMIEALARQGDWLLTVARYPGPTTLVRGRAADDALDLAGAITVRYSKAASEPKASVWVRRAGDAGDHDRRLDAAPATAEVLARLRIPHEDGGWRRRGE